MSCPILFLQVRHAAQLGPEKEAIQTLVECSMNVKYDVIFTFDVCAPRGAVQAVPRRFCKRSSDRPFRNSCHTLLISQAGRVACLNGFFRVGRDFRSSLQHACT